jgi:hypothetical protein
MVSYFDNIVGRVPSDVEAMRTAGSVGDIMGYAIDPDGKILDIELNHRLVGISVEFVEAVNRWQEFIAITKMVFSNLRRLSVGPCGTDVAR